MGHPGAKTQGRSARWDPTDSYHIHLKNEPPTHTIIEEEVTDDIDELSHKGLFGWERFSDFHFPFVARLDRKYCSLRMLSTVLSDRLQPEASEILHRKAVHATVAEAHLLNVINVHHSSCSFGSDLFIVGDLLIELNNVHSFINFLNDCYKLCGQSVPTDDRCGLIRINKEVVVPYVIITGNKNVPLFYFKNATKVELNPDKFERKKMNEWDHCYLRFCCRIIGKVSEEFYVNEDYFVDLLNVTPYLSFYAEIEEYWPHEYTCSIACSKENNDKLAVKKSEVQSKKRGRCRSPNLHNYKENEMPDYVNIESVENSSDSSHKLEIGYPESESMREVRLRKMREIAKENRRNETPDQRETRLARLRIYQAKRLANEKPEQRERRLAKLRLYNSLKKNKKLQTKTDSP